jgi:hypothetical protein
MKAIVFILILGFTSSTLFAQGPYSPAADSLGSTAIHKDSNAIVSWVSNAVVTRGPVNITNPTGPLADVGTVSSATGIADGNVLSLGDGGFVVITLSQPLADRPSYDFAVFENGFYDMGNGGYFLELAFVEVSSDGINFFRFPNHSLTDTDVQTGSFGATDPTQIDGLAGKYTMTYGTPFDLAQLNATSGLDINQITHIKIIDVIGSVNSNDASYDSRNRIINDPYPTAFGSGGFDLDAIAILDSSFATGVENITPLTFNVYPNPATNVIHITDDLLHADLTIYNQMGSAVLTEENVSNSIDINALNKGFYLVVLQKDSILFKARFIKL